MGKFFNQAVCERFGFRMSELSDFSEVKLPKNSDHLVLPGERLYQRVRGSVWDWVLLVTSPKGYNNFSVECGFSRLSRFPKVTMRPSIFDLDSASLAVDEGFFILRDEEHDYSQKWSIVDELSIDLEDVERLVTDLSKDEAEELANPLVDEAFEVLLRCGISTLNDVN